MTSRVGQKDYFGNEDSLPDSGRHSREAWSPVSNLNNSSSNNSNSNSSSANNNMNNSSTTKINVSSASDGVRIDTKGCRIKRVRSILDEEYITGCTDEFVSPIKAMKANFRMNQMFGIFPYSITKDFMTFTFRPLRLGWFFILKLSLVSLIILMLHLWLRRDGYYLADLWERAFGHDSFSRTDYFAIISHYLFLQGSANFIYFVNLKLGRELTKLNANLKELTETISEGHIRANPSAFRMMCYRYFVCFLCTMASVIYLSGIHRIIRNPDSADVMDAAIIVFIAFALYIENQNHMFTELLFLRFLTILRHHFSHTLEHLKMDHPTGRGARSCCYSRCKTLYDMFIAINKTFGLDLLITVTILVISIAFGVYLFLAFTVFIGDHGDHALFIIAYLMYWIIPGLRLFVIVEGSESIRKGIRKLRYQLDAIETDILCGDKSARKIQYTNEISDVSDSAVQAKAMIGLNGEATFDLARLRRVSKLFSEVSAGFSASGFFSLNRGILTALIGSLVTYLIVLLQFKVTDMAERSKLDYAEAVRTLTNVTAHIQTGLDIKN